MNNITERIFGIIYRKNIDMEFKKTFKRNFFLLSILNALFGLLSLYFLVGERLRCIILYGGEKSKVAKVEISQKNFIKCVPLKLNKKKYLELVNVLVETTKTYSNNYENCESDSVMKTGNTYDNNSFV